MRKHFVNKLDLTLFIVYSYCFITYQRKTSLSCSEGNEELIIDLQAAISSQTKKKSKKKSNSHL